MRRVFAITVLAALALVMAAGAPAYADPGGNGNGQGNPPGHAGNGNNGNGNGGGNDGSPAGFNGTVKIHDGNGEAEPIRRNEPHVGCTFHIHGFNFDAGSSGTWSIQSWPPTGDRSVVASGSWGPADGEGDWRTAVMSLPGGDHNQGAHYKLNVDQTNPSAPGAEKHKVFWVDCPPVTGGAGGGGEEEEDNVGGQQQNNVGGQQQNNAVAGVQQPPMSGAVSPTVETAAQPGAQAPAQVAGQQAAPVTSLPSTSTAQTAPFITPLLLGIGMWLMRRRFGDR
jgi:hypothetical protein